MPTYPNPAAGGAASENQYYYEPPSGDYKFEFEANNSSIPATNTFEDVYDNGWFNLELVRTAAGLLVIRIASNEACVYRSTGQRVTTGFVSEDKTLSSTLETILNTNSKLERLDAYVWSADNSKSARIFGLAKVSGGSNSADLSITIFGDEADIKNTL